MKLHCPGIERNDTGGGSSFLRNFAKAMGSHAVQIVPTVEECDILFIAGASLSDRGIAEKAKELGKAIVLRVDNILEDSKNRNTGMPRMIDFASWADVIIYQSKWAERLLMPHCGAGIVIYNGVDTDIFYPRKEAKDWENKRFIYSKFSRGEGKNFNVVQYWWREHNLKNSEDLLFLAGRFSDEIRNINHPFEFHNDEQVDYRGVLEPEQMAELLRQCDYAILPYFADACSNTILEAQACGVPVLYNHSGGTPEIVSYGEELSFEHEDILEMCDSQVFNFEEFKHEWGLEPMGRKYYALFTTVLAPEIETEITL